MEAKKEAQMFVDKYKHLGLSESTANECALKEVGNIISLLSLYGIHVDLKDKIKYWESVAALFDRSKGDTHKAEILIIDKWKFIRWNEENMKNMPKDRDFEVLFENGYECKYSDKHPQYEIIAWREFATS